MVERLKLAVVGVFEPSMDVLEIDSLLSQTNIKYERLSLLSPNRLALFFDYEDDLTLAMNSTSPLLNIFTEIHRWSEDMTYNTRLIWLECVGLNPICWGMESFKKIGELWGTTLKIDHVMYGAHCITAARVLVLTSNPERIQQTVDIEWEHGACKVWVNEIYEWDGRRIKGNGDNSENDICTAEQENQVEDKDTAAEAFNGPDHGTEHFEKENLVAVENNMTPEQIIHEAHNELNVNITVQNVDNMQLVNENTNILMLEGQHKVSDVQRNRVSETEGLGIPRTLENPESSQEDQEVQNHCEDAKLGRQCDCVSDETQTDIATYRQYVGENVTDDRFDPIATIECSIIPELRQKEMNISTPINGVTSSMGNKTRKTRGRPKRVTCSLPEPLFVPSTPSNSNIESENTWETAKKIGVKARNEKVVMSELRKSKRLMAMMEDNPNLG